MLKQFVIGMIILFSLYVNGIKPASAGLIGYWNFDEPSTERVAQATVGGVNGTLVAGVQFNPTGGICGGAVEISDGYVDMGDNFPSTSSFSVQAWIKIGVGDTSGMVPVAKHQGTIAQGYFLAINNIGDGYTRTDTAGFYSANGSYQTAVGGPPVNDGLWHQLVGVYDNGITSIYIDSKLAGTGSAGYANNSAHLMIGGLFDPAGIPINAFNGSIDEVKIYDHALSQVEVKQLYDDIQADSDGDGIYDGGDCSGTIGDNPCAGGLTENCDDNCRSVYNPDQRDVDGDGVGDVCESTTVLELHQEILTSGALDFESFKIDGEHYLAVANYHNDASYNNVSKIYKWNGQTFDEIQSINTNGAWDWESFEIDGVTYLAVANQFNGSNHNVYSFIYRWDGSTFTEAQSVLTAGALDWESFTINGETYLAVANHYNGSSYNIDSKIYKWNTDAFEEIQSIATSGAIHWESFTINNETYLAVANSYNGSSYNVDSKIYKWDGTSFIEIQAIPTSGSYDLESFSIDGETYLALANYYNGTTRNLESKIYKWNGASFDEVQSIPTKGALDWENFEVDGETYLIVANHHNDATYNTGSRLYRWNGALFEKVQNILTNGASDWESYTIDNQTYIAAANHFNDATHNIHSKIFKATSKSLGDGLVAYYPFDSSFEDRSGHELHLTAHGDIALGNDRFDTAGNACFFDGVDDYLSIPSNPLLNPKDQLTITFWIKRDSALNEWALIIHKGGVQTSNFSNREYAVGLHSSANFVLASAGDNSGQHDFNSSITKVDEWMFYTAVIDRKNHQVCIFLNDQLDQEFSDNYATFNTNNDELRIGWTEETYSTFSRFFGSLDDIRIYNRALTEAEISKLYNCTNRIKLSLPQSVTEGDGTLANQGIVNVFPAPKSDLTVYLNSDDTTKVAVPDSVTIAAGTSSVTFDIMIGEDSIVDCARSVTIRATAGSYMMGSASVQVDDNDCPGPETVWRLSGSPYLVTSDTTIPAGETLMIEPGVTVQFAENARLNVQGTLNVEGALDNPVTFTSAIDSPASGNWWGIYFSRGSSGTLSHAVIEYAQYGVYIDGNGAKTISDCTIRYNNRGIQARFDGTIPELVIHRSALHDNTEYNYVLDGDTWNTTTLDARDNWWGTDDPVAIAATIFDYFDYATRGVVDFTGFLDSEGGNPVPGNYLIGATSGDKTLTQDSYIVPSSFYIRPGHTLTIPAGTTLSFETGQWLRVYGSLLAEGSESDKITFTSKAASPAANDWWGIYFSRGSTGTLSHAIIEYAQYGVYIDGNGAKTISDCTIRYNNRGIQANFDGTIPELVIHRSALHDNTEYNYVLDGDTWNTTTLDARDNWWGTADPVAIADTIYDCFDHGSRGVIDYTGFLDSPDGSAVPGDYLIGATNEDTTLTAANYIVPGSYWVRPDHTLTIPAGTTLSFGSGKYLTVSGVLTAVGFESEKITFTSSAAEPAAGDWQYIHFSDGSSGHLSHCEIAYADYGINVYSSDYQTSVTIENCILHHNTTGLYANQRCTVGVTESVFRDNVYGVRAYAYYHHNAGAYVPDITINNSKLYDNTVNYLLEWGRTYSWDPGAPWGATVLDATNNWWGTQNELEIAETIWDSQDDGNLGTVNFDPWLFEMPDDEGPVVSNIRFNGAAVQSGDSLTQPGTLTLHAMDALSGMQRVEFYVNGELQHIDYNNTGNYRFDWDLVAIKDDSYDITIRAFDNHPNANMTEVILENIQVELAPPPIPVVTAPVAPDSGLLVSWNTLTVSGTANTNTSITVYNNDESVASNIPVNAQGQFQVVIGLNKGRNSIQVSATHRGGESKPSKEVVVNVDPAALFAPTGFIAEPREGGVIRLSWSDTGEASIKGYDIHRSGSEFNSKAEATKVNASPITGTVYNDLPMEDGTYYYRVLAIDPADNESALSNQSSAVSDSTPPRAVSIQYMPSGPYDEATGRMGPGIVDILLTVSEPLLAKPFLSITPEGGMPISVELTKTSDLEYSGLFVISETTPTGTAYAVFSGRDLVGNRGTEIDAGGVIQIDTDGPLISSISIQPEQPIRNDNDEDNPVSVTVTIGLNEPMKPGEIPELSYLLSGEGRSEIQIEPLTQIGAQPGHAETWRGSFLLPADAGLAEVETFHFVYRGVDDLDNVSTTILCENSFQVYQGDLPPLASPEGLTGESLPGGKIRLSWHAVEGAVGYQLYRKAPDESELTAYERLETVLEFVDEPSPDGLYTYAIASIRQENEQESISGMSNSVEVASDSVAPGAPQNLVLELLGSGIKATWEAPPNTEPITYTLYRANLPEITSVEGLPPVLTGITQTTVVDSHPSPTDHSYVVTAVDEADNESAPSNSVCLHIPVLPVSTLSVLQSDNNPPIISWTHSGGSIAGYDVYLGPEHNMVKLNKELLPNPSYKDTGYAEDERRYTVVAVDEYGHESVGRSITLPLLRATLTEGSQVKRGIMNRLEYTVENRSPSRVDKIRLKVQVGAYLHSSESFDIEPAASQVVAVAVGGHAGLPDPASLTTTVAVTPNTGELVEIVRTSEIEVGDGMLVAQILNEEFLRGGTGTVRFTLENTGGEEIEIVTATDAGRSPSNEITFYLLDSDGNVLSSVPFKQNLGEGIVTLANGKTVARIPARGAFTSKPLELAVPLSCPDEVIIQLHIGQVHFHLGRPEHVSIDGLNTTRAISLIDTSYYGEVLTIAPGNSNGEEDIVITGRAVERDTGLPMPQVPLRLTVSLNGFERTYDVFTDSEGMFSFAFTPFPGESGLYKVWAVHPDLLDKPVQGQFVINRISITPSTINLNTPRNYEKKISIQVSAGEGTEVNNVRLAYDALDQPGNVYPEGMHITIGSPVATLSSGQKKNLDFSIWGDNSAQESGRIVFKVKSDETGEDSWGTIIINTHFSEAKPALYFAPDHIETGIALEDSVTETIVLENRGLANLNDVSLALIAQDGTAAPSWVHLNSDNEQGLISVGENREISISFSPTSSTSEGLYSFYLRVASQNYPTTDIGLYVTVTQSGMGNVLFKVTDIYTGSLNQDSEIIQGLADASIRMQNEMVSTIEQTLSTDSAGEALFSDLPAGRYKCRVSAPNHQDYIARVWVKPGITTNEKVFLGYNLVTVEWEVVETTIEDKYEIVLNATYETDVPAAVVVAEPPSTTLPTMKEGDVYNGEFTLTNYGLIRADNVQYILPENDQNFKYELLAHLPDTIDPKERITVPYRVTCLQSLEQEDEGSGGQTSGCYTYQVCIQIPYGYVCVNGTWVQAWTTYCYTVVYGQCGGPGSPSTGTGGGGGTWNIGGGSGGVGGSSAGPSWAPSPQPVPGALCKPERSSPVDDPCQEREVGEEAGSLVDLTRGEYLDDVEDLFVKVQGHRIEVRRRYYDDKWYFAHAEGLELNYGPSGQLVDNFRKDGVKYSRRSSIGGLYIYRRDPRFAASRYISITSSGYLWKDNYGNWREYDSFGQLLSYGDRNYVKVRVMYDGATGNLIGIKDHFGKQVLWYENDSQGNIISVRDAEDWASARWVRYEYVGDKLLKVITKVTDAAENEVYYEYTYVYDEQERLISKQDEEGRIVNIIYNHDGYVTSVKDDEGMGVTFEYAYNSSKKEFYALVGYSNERLKEVWIDRYGNRIKTKINGRITYQASFSERSKTVEDAIGNKTYRTYDEWGNLTKRTYPDGASINYEYEPKQMENGARYFNLKREIDERGIITEYEYDDAGNMMRKTEARGTASERITEYTYDELGNQLTVRQLGDDTTQEAITTMTYDDCGNMTSLSDPEGYTNYFTYDRMGNVLEKIDAQGPAFIPGIGEIGEAGIVWRYIYDEKGRQITSKDPLGNTSIKYYDGVGNLIREIDAEGNEKRYEYDKDNNLIRSIDALGNITQYFFNTEGKLTRQIDPEGKEMRYEYDRDNRLVKIIDGNRNEIIQVYDDETPECATCPGGSLDQPSKIIYPTYTKKFIYDSRGRKVGEKDILSESEEYITTFVYDSSGNLVAQTDKEGQITIYEYDVLNRVVNVVVPLGHKTLYSYDDRDNMIALTDTKGNVTRFQYDRNNQKVKETRPLGEETRFEYNQLGYLSKKLDAKGQKTELMYDAAGRQVMISYFSAEEQGSPVKSVTFTYDKVGNIKSYNDGTTSAGYVYDDVYRKISESVNYGPFELGYTYTYYKNGKKKSFTGPNGITYEYAYDNNNQLASILVPSQGYITYNTYTWNRPASISLPGGAKREYTYDPLMRIELIISKDPAQNSIMNYQYTYDRMDNILKKETEHESYVYGYDKLYQLIEADNPSMDDEAYSYDAVGNRLNLAGVEGEWSYNGNNELLNYNGISYEYDNNGNTIRKTAYSEITNYIYDGEDRLIRVEDGEGNVVGKYCYDPFGRRLWKEVNGIKTYFVYSEEGLVGEFDASGNEIKTYGYVPDSIWTTDPLFQKVGGDYYWYQNDHLGTSQKIIDTGGATAWSGNYSAFGTIIEDITKIENKLRFPGQYYDEETGLYYNWHRYYDFGIGRYLSTEPISIASLIIDINQIPLYDYLSLNPHLQNGYLYSMNNSISYFDPDGEFAQAGTVILTGGVGIGAGTVTAVGGIVAVAICLSIEECRDFLKKIPRIRCRIKREPPHHYFPGKGYCKHIRITCWIKGIKNSTFFEKQIPYGKCCP